MYVESIVKEPWRIFHCCEPIGLPHRETVSAVIVSAPIASKYPGIAQAGIVGTCRANGVRANTSTGAAFQPQMAVNARQMALYEVGICIDVAR